ncbi:hypothetical protein OZX58_01210 [Lactobacillus sp. ESL0680]|uniref:hypothetical protein n=1 Tax=Lactobacillus sp. ESL0680 TaxID=2983210 RepID=UPI0023F792C2|nr:hypothetical protein [Lactobacillus sp. ESL0680]WEV38924.1 hypothetical protein OZX58_01210 [Lactobacillus sp. ESL0680]
MKKSSGKKIFWTCLSFLTFGLFSLALISKNYWLNIFVIVLGMLINKKGSDALFIKKSFIAKSDMRRKNNL